MKLDLAFDTAAAFSLLNSGSIKDSQPRESSQSGVSGRGAGSGGDILVVGDGISDSDKSGAGEARCV